MYVVGSHAVKLWFIRQWSEPNTICIGLHLIQAYVIHLIKNVSVYCRGLSSVEVKYHWETSYYPGTVFSWKANFLQFWDAHTQETMMTGLRFMHSNRRHKAITWGWIITLVSCIICTLKRKIITVSAYTAQLSANHQCCKNKCFQ